MLFLLYTKVIGNPMYSFINTAEADVTRWLRCWTVIYPANLDKSCCYLYELLAWS